MAKEKKEKSKSNEILDHVKKNYGNYIFQLPLKDQKYDPGNFIHSGSYSLNYLITGDMLCGIPKGKIIEMFGAESVGKTSLALSIAKQAAKNKQKVLYGDFERGLNQYYASQLGIDSEYFYYFKPDFGEQGFDLAEDLLKKFKFDLFVCDSVGGAKTKSQLEGDYSKATMGVHSVMFGKVATRFSKIIDKRNIAMILINQLSSTIGTYGKSEDTKGGKTLKYFEWCRIQLKTLRSNKIVSKIKSLSDFDKDNEEEENEEDEGKTKKTEETGILVDAKSVKNKLYKPQLTCQMKLIYGEGFNEEWDLINFLTLKGIIQSNKEKTKVKYKKKTFTDKEFFNIFINDKEFKNEIVMQVK